jgi:hypothetical protein
MVKMVELYAILMFELLKWRYNIRVDLNLADTWLQLLKR